MRLIVSTVFFLALPTSTHAATWYGADLGGGDMILADGDVVDGVFTNVGRLEVPVGATVTVQPTVHFQVYAQDIAILGTLDGIGAGHAGGAGGPLGSAVEGDPGTGPGAGNPGKQGPCIHGGGGGGGGYGGPGGDGGYIFVDGNTHYPNRGIAYGAMGGTSAELGSGGAGGGSGCSDAGGTGGAGGGSVTLVAPTVQIDGAILVNGEDGLLGDYWGGHGGGGSGGSIVIEADTLTGIGLLEARGGLGGGPEEDASYESDGGGGSGGRIKLISCAGSPLTNDVSGGAAGGTCLGGSIYCPSDGADGTIDDSSADNDYDGLANGCDNCPDIANADQFDADNDGAGDVCDLCPGQDDQLDADLDTIPDGCDICADHDDLLDPDGDGVPSGCDDCPQDALDDSDGDGICDSNDRCPGGDDRLDMDGDQRPDDCDNCPMDENPSQADGDDDGAGAVCDCDDDAATVYPGADEYCNGVDDDCDGTVDNDGIDGWTYYADDDGDYAGDPNDSVTDCNPVDGYVNNDNDCDDTDPKVHGDAVEACDGIDNDCDGDVDEDAGCPTDNELPGGSAGCGCNQTGPGTGGVLWLGLLAMLARRRGSIRASRSRPRG